MAEVSKQNNYDGKTFYYTGEEWMNVLAGTDEEMMMYNCEVNSLPETQETIHLLKNTILRK